MKQSGYLMTCSRCGLQEFIEKEGRDRWVALMPVPVHITYTSYGRKIKNEDDEDEEPKVEKPTWTQIGEGKNALDICPACHLGLKAVMDAYLGSFEDGVLMYTRDGQPIFMSNCGELPKVPIGVGAKDKAEKDDKKKKGEEG